MKLPRAPWRITALATLALLAGCAAQREHSAGMGLLADGKLADGVESLRRAAALAPDNAGYRIDYLQRRERAEGDLLAAAASDRAAGRPQEAALKLRDALRLHPGSARAQAALREMEAERRVGEALPQVERLFRANHFDEAAEQLKRLLAESPRHEDALALQRQVEQRRTELRNAREDQLAARAAFKRPVTLQFRDAPLRMVFESMAKAGNVNLILDRDVKADVRTTIFVRDASIEDALDVILMQNQLERRQLSSNTMLIYPATAARQKELAELKVRSFQISNVDVGFIANLVKTLVKTRDIVTDTKTNTLVMRDTPEAVALAERIVAANDLADPEIMLEVEVLEVSSTRLSDIGLKLPSSVTLSVPNGSASGSTSGSTSPGLTYGTLRGLRRDDLLVSPLQATLNLMVQDGDASVLARPQLRSRNREKARILVGDRLPIITNLLAPQQAGQNSVVTGSIQYVEVGIKLEVEPQVYGDGDIGIKLNLEVSNVTDTIQTESGRAYQIGTRSAQSSVRLRDGETQLLGGLISDADRQSAYKVPGLGQLPIVGRLFSDHSGDRRKSEIVLSITPRIVRPQAQPDPRFADAWSGTEAMVRDRALRLEPVGTVKVPASDGAPALAPPPAPAPAAAAPAPAAASAPASAAASAPAPAAALAPAPAAASAPAPAAARPAAPVQIVPVAPRFSPPPAAAASAPESRP